jgi:DNA-directed RNA polymerase specialized sigma24 family protein
MMQFTEQIQRAFEETVRSGALSDVDKLPERLRDYLAPGRELDSLWADLLRHFQEGPRQPWATVLLEAMRPDLAAAVAIVPAFPPVVTQEDFAQQLMANLLTAALERPVQPARWTAHRLISHASRDTQRWLAREIFSFAKRAGYVDRKAGSISGLELPSLLLELEMKQNPSTGLVVLYRQEVLGDSIEEMAAECGLTENALRLRRRRAIERIRRELDAA